MTLPESKALLVWWTSQADCEAIGADLPPAVPAYLRRQYADRRNGRGRLWIAPHFPAVSADLTGSTREAEAARDCAGIVINPGGLSHTSVVLRDALSGVGLPVAEVHISDVRRREEFRHHSYVADVAAVHVIGEGVDGYATAVDLLCDIITGQADG